MNVTRVLRASLSRVNGSVMDELFAARERAVVTQPVEGLRVSVMHSSGWFVQWLEGPETAVEAKLKRSWKSLLMKDTPSVIHRSTGEPTLKEPFTLLTTQWPESASQFAQRIEAAQRAQPPLEPAEIWRRLAEPCTLAGQAPSRRIAVVAADDTRSIDLVRKIADRFGVPMVYQRFANSDMASRDVGAAYADLPIEGEPTRVQVLSKRALGHRMVRDSLRGAHKLAVLLGPRPSGAIELADSLAGFVRATPQAPHIDLVGECAEVAHSVGEYLGRQLRRAVSSRVSEATESRLFEVLLGPEPLPRAA